MTKRIEEFTCEGKSFVYIDFSGLKANDAFQNLMELIKPVIAKYPEKSLYTVTNIASGMFDSDVRKTAAEYLRHNEPYVKYGAIIGLDGIKKMICNAIIKVSGRTNMTFAFTREQAIDWLLKQN